MFLYIARHAWAGERDDDRYPDDSLRELTPEGILRYEEVLKALTKRGFAPQQIATSPYLRCRQTAEIIANHISGNPLITQLSDLEPGSNLAPLIEWTHSRRGSNVCWVGHVPDVEQFTAALIGDNSARIRFAKGAVASIEFDDDEVFLGGGELYWLATAKLLGL